MDPEVIAIEKLSATVRAEICAFLDSQDTAHPFQFPQWTEAGGIGGPSLCCLWRNANALAAYASGGVQRPAGTRVPLRALVINRGPVCDDVERWPETLDGLVRIAKVQKFIYVDAAPERLISDSSGVFFSTAWKSLGGERASLRLDLTPGEDEIFVGFRKVTRYEVRRAEKAGIRLATASAKEDSERFLDLYLRVAKRKGFAADAPEFVREILKWLQAEPGRGRLFLAWHQDVAAAGAVVVRAGRRCWYVWGASEQSRNFSAGHLLQWNAIQWAKAQGCTEYDFGGYTPGAESGPAWFKEGFGGKVVRLVPTHRLVLRQAQYRLLQVASSARRKLRKR